MIRLRTGHCEGPWCLLTLKIFLPIRPANGIDLKRSQSSNTGRSNSSGESGRRAATDLASFLAAFPWRSLLVQRSCTKIGTQSSMFTREHDRPSVFQPHFGYQLSGPLAWSL
jgi:hypothetical protein